MQMLDRLETTSHHLMLSVHVQIANELQQADAVLISFDTCAPSGFPSFFLLSMPTGSFISYYTMKDSRPLYTAAARLTKLRSGRAGDDACRRARPLGTGTKMRLRRTVGRRRPELLRRTLIDPPLNRSIP